MRVWTPERVAMLREHYPQHGSAILDALNSLPGRPIKNREALICQASLLGVKLDPEAHRNLVSRAMLTHFGAAPPPPVVITAEPPPPPADPEPPPLTAAESAALADARLAARHDKARAMLRRKTEPAIVATHTKLPLREVFRLVGEMRA
jgi:hypothetical protein